MCSSELILQGIPLVLGLLFGVSGAAPAVDLRVDRSVLAPDGSRWYHRSRAIMDAASARAFAEAHGGTLVCIEDEVEDRFLEVQFTNGHPQWIGLDSRLDTWANGEPIAYTNWLEAPPDPNGPLLYGVRAWCPWGEDTKVCEGRDGAWSLRSDDVIRYRFRALIEVPIAVPDDGADDGPEP